ncbi:MAG: septation protein A [Sulfuriflexus sp.]|nr:septation protein A [Sulfuriflexus sp.]
MKMLFDFFPILLFFIAFKTYDIYVATITAIVATFVQVILFWLKYRRFEKMHVITLVLISVFGGISIYLQDPLYIKLKTTLLEWIFAIVFIGSQYIGKKSIVERMMGNAMTAPDDVWKKLNYAWAGFFTLVGFINLYIVYNFDTETWVNFKTFGLLGLTITFIIIQGVFMAKYVIQDDDDNEDAKKEAE